jgi:hypothetical protein
MGIDQRWRLFLLFCCALAGLGCATAPVAPAAGARPAAPAVELAPAPFTAAQIRDASLPGRHFELRTESAGRPATVLSTTFKEVTETDALIETTVFDDVGKAITGPSAARAAWADLVHHGEFPKAALVVTEAPLDTVLGPLDCFVYTVTKGAGDAAVVSHFYFAKTLPGPPIHFFTDKGGQRVSTTTLIKYQPGSR